MQDGALWSGFEEAAGDTCFETFVARAVGSRCVHAPAWEEIWDKEGGGALCG